MKALFQKFFKAVFIPFNAVFGVIMKFIKKVSGE